MRDFDVADDPQEKSPLDWSVLLTDLPTEGLKERREATRQEIEHIEAVLGKSSEVEVVSLSCDYELKPHMVMSGKGDEAVNGRFHVIAQLRQTCVVTLERIDTVVDERFEQDFVTGTPRAGGDEKHDADDPFAEEPPLPIRHGHILFGPLVYEYFAMAIDPNPRKPGAAFESDESEHPDDDRPASPFEALRRMKPDGRPQ